MSLSTNILNGGRYTDNIDSTNIVNNYIIDNLTNKKYHYKDSDFRSGTRYEVIPNQSGFNNLNTFSIHMSFVFTDITLYNVIFAKNPSTFTDNSAYSNPYQLLSVVLYAGKVRLRVSDSITNYYDLDSLTTLIENKLYNVSITFSSGAAKIYINGALDNSITHALTQIGSSNNDIYIGKWAVSNYPNGIYKGLILRTEFYNIVHSQTDVTKYNNDETLSTTGILFTKQFEKTLILDNGAILYDGVWLGNQCYNFVLINSNNISLITKVKLNTIIGYGVIFSYSHFAGKYNISIGRDVNKILFNYIFNNSTVVKFTTDNTFNVNDVLEIKVSIINGTNNLYINDILQSVTYTTGNAVTSCTPKDFVDCVLSIGSGADLRFNYSYPSSDSIYYAKIYEDNMIIAYYDADNINGTILTDRAGNSNLALTDSPTLINGKLGKSIAFNGSSQRAFANIHSSLNTNSITIFIRANVRQSTFYPIITFSGASRYCYIGTYDGNNRLEYIIGDSTALWFRETGARTLVKFLDIVLVLGTNGNQMYIDGKKAVGSWLSGNVNSTNSIATEYANLNTFELACYKNSTFANTDIDNCIIYNRSFTEKEISQQYNQRRR